MQLPLELVGDGFIDVSWKFNSAENRVEIWVDTNDDGQFSEVDIYMFLNGVTTFSLEDLVDNFAVWRGTQAADSYTGNAPDNVAYGLGGNDVLDGGDGNDSFYGYNGSGAMSGGAGNDVFTAYRGTWTIDGGAGDDRFELGANGASYASTDQVQVATGGTGADTFQFMPSSTFDYADRVTDFSGADGDKLQLYGISAGRASYYYYWPLANASTLFRGSMDAANFVLGAALPGDDIGTGFAQFWTVQTGGNTYLVGDTDGDLVLDETDFVVRFDGLVSLSASDFVAGTFVAIAGTAGDDVLTGDDAVADQIYGGAGNDTLNGLAGDDALYGGIGGGGHHTRALAPGQRIWVACGQRMKLVATQRRTV